MIDSRILTPRELAAEAYEALRNAPAESPQEHFARLVRLGFVNARGEVTRLIGGAAEPEPEEQGGPPADSSQCDR